ncbi:MAG TPA: YlxR family protein, partial [Candidatus Bathyarchaeia archaeon]|nr:YlxR family protein [Candidatus Bathyarchaeia archaeon]
MKRRKQPRTPRLDPRLGAEIGALRAAGHAGHVAVRTCAGCARPSPRGGLHRFVLGPGGGLEWRATGGRGAYLHPELRCVDRFLSGKASVSGLKARVDRRSRHELMERAPF